MMKSTVGTYIQVVAVALVGAVGVLAPPQAEAVNFMRDIHRLERRMTQQFPGPRVVDCERVPPVKLPVISPAERPAPAPSAELSPPGSQTDGERSKL